MKIFQYLYSMFMQLTSTGIIRYLMSVLVCTRGESIIVLNMEFDRKIVCCIESYPFMYIADNQLLQISLNPVCFHIFFQPKLYFFQRRFPHAWEPVLYPGDNGCCDQCEGRIHGLGFVGYQCSGQSSHVD